MPGKEGGQRPSVHLLLCHRVIPQERFWKISVCVSVSRERGGEKEGNR